MDLGMQLGMGQRLEQTLSPMMIQSLKLLQVNTLELEAIIQQELESNPILEAELDDEEAPPVERLESTPTSSDDSGTLNENGSDSTDSGSDSSDSSEAPETSEPAEAEAEGIDWEEYLSDGFEMGSRSSDYSEAAEEGPDRSPAHRGTYEERLLAQLGEKDLTPEVRAVAEYLIACLDEDGWLRPPLAGTDAEPLQRPTLAHDDDYPWADEVEELIAGRKELFDATPVVRDGFHALQSLEPPGIGARDLRECLLIQMRRRDFDNPLAQRILEEAFPLFERLQVSMLARQFGVTPAEIQAAFAAIGTLDPRPGRTLDNSVTSSVIPDIVVERHNGELVMYLNDRHIPRLYVSQYYVEMLRKGSGAGTEEKQFVKQKLESANWLIRSIDQRRSTIQKVMRAILEKQRDFFEKGPSFLRPMILQDIAEEIGMHISTVNRVTNGKYVQTESGIYELKDFFTSSVAQDDGSEQSSAQIKEALKELMSTEDPADPLSDQKLAELLEKRKGLQVARRTVAKYREAMGILSARLRRKF